VVPFQLAKGILLEDSDVLLPWGAPLPDLRKTGRPDLYRERGVTTLSWKDRRFLGGLAGAVEAEFNRTPAPEGEEDPNDEGRLRVVNFYIDPEPRETPRRQHLRVQKRLSRSLGKPSRAGEDPTMHLPIAEWDLARVLVVWMVFERFGEYCVGEIWQKPLPRRRTE
jgi:hypothetical protein